MLWYTAVSLLARHVHLLFPLCLTGNSRLHHSFSQHSPSLALLPNLIQFSFGQSACLLNKLQQYIFTQYKEMFHSRYVWSVPSFLAWCWGQKDTEINCLGEQSRTDTERSLLPTGLNPFFLHLLFSAECGSSRHNLQKKENRQLFLPTYILSAVCCRFFYHWKGKWNKMVVTAGILRVMGVRSPVTVTINLKNHMPPVWSLNFSIRVCSQRDIITLKEPAVQCKGTHVTRELWCEKSLLKRNEKHLKYMGCIHIKTVLTVAFIHIFLWSQ